MFNIVRYRGTSRNNFFTHWRQTIGFYIIYCTPFQGRFIPDLVWSSSRCRVGAVYAAWSRICCPRSICNIHVQRSCVISQNGTLGSLWFIRQWSVWSICPPCEKFILFTKTAAPILLCTMVYMNRRTYRSLRSAPPAPLSFSAVAVAAPCHRLPARHHIR